MAPAAYPEISTCSQRGETKRLDASVRILWNQESTELSTSESTDNF
jgi:hypothetical protein